MQFVDQLSAWLAEKGVMSNVITTSILIVLVFATRALVFRWLQGVPWADEQARLRWRSQIRWASALFLLGGIAVIWASELQSLAISLVAIAAAIVLATKELIMCFSGSLVRTTSRAFKITDRIELDGVRGDVVDIGALTTTVLEVGPNHRRTGRVVVLPNSLLLTKSVVNETFTDEFVLHTMNIPLEPAEDWHEREQHLLRAAQVACEPYLKDAIRLLDASTQAHGLPSFSVEPSVSVHVLEGGKISLGLRFPVRAAERHQSEQQVLREFLAQRTSGADGGTGVVEEV